MEPSRPRKVAGRYAILSDPSCIIRQSRPDVRLFIQRGLTIQERDRYNYPPGSVFLDGVPGLLHISIGCMNSYMKYAKLIELRKVEGN